MAVAVAAFGISVHATPYSDAVVADNPVGYWRFEEAPISPVADSSGNGNTGNYNGAPSAGSLGTANLGVAVSFDDTDSRVAVVDDAIFTLGTEYSLEVWVQAQSGETGVLMTNRFPVPGGDGFELAIASGGRPSVRHDNGGGDVTFQATAAGAVVNDGAVHHVVTTYDGAFMRFHVDGVQVDTIAGSGGAGDGTSLSFGVGHSLIDPLFPATVDEVAIYDTTLSANRVQAHFYAASGTIPPVASAPFFAISCVPSTGPCTLLNIDFDGTTSSIGTLPPGACEQFGGGMTAPFVPSAIEGLAFDSAGDLWGAGDNAAQSDVEYLFKIDPDTGAVLECREAVLGGGTNVNDLDGLAPWDEQGRLFGPDIPEEDLVYFFDPTSLALDLACDDPQDGRSTGVAKFPTDSHAYSIEDGNQLLRFDRSGSSCSWTDLGALSPAQAGVNSLTAVPLDGMLYGIDTADDHLLAIDPSNANVTAVALSPAPAHAVSGLAYRRSPAVPIGIPSGLLSAFVLTTGWAVLARAARSRRKL